MPKYIVYRAVEMKLRFNVSLPTTVEAKSHEEAERIVGKSPDETVKANFIAYLKSDEGQDVAVDAMQDVLQAIEDLTSDDLTVGEIEDSELEGDFFHGR